MYEKRMKMPVCFKRTRAYHSRHSLWKCSKDSSPHACQPQFLEQTLPNTNTHTHTYTHFLHCNEAWELSHTKAKVHFASAIVWNCATAISKHSAKEHKKNDENKMKRKCLWLAAFVRCFSKLLLLLLLRIFFVCR